jgi:hypothetical protein
VKTPALLLFSVAVLLSTASAAAEPKPVLRIALTGFASNDIPPSWVPVVEASTLTELRKLARVNVIGFEEVKSMLDFEAQKQLLGCSESSCLSEIGEALGVDVVVSGSLSTVGGEHVFGLRRIDEKRAEVAGTVTRRFAAGNGEEFLAAIGPAVAELFPDVPLKPGATRGVPEEIALKLHPPPLPPAVFYGGLGLTGAAGATTAVLAVANQIAFNDQLDYRNTAVPFDVATFNKKSDAVDQSALGFWISLGATAVIGAASAVSFLFTNFDNASTP